METKNVVMAIALSLVVLIGWQFIDNYRVNGDFSNFDRPLARSAPSIESVTENLENNDIGAPVHGGENLGGSQNLTAPSFTTRTEIIEDGFAQKQRILVRNQRIEGSITLKGARLDDITLLDYRETLDDDSDRVHFLLPAQSAKPYFAEFGWIKSPKLAETLTLPSADTLWEADGAELTPDRPLTLQWTSPEGVVFKQIYTLDDDFMITVTQQIENMEAINSNLSDYFSVYGRLMRHGIPDELSQLYILHEGLIGFLQDGLEEVDYDEIAEEPGQIKSWDSEIGWLGITDKYWLAALIPDQQTPFKARMLSQPSSVGDQIEDRLYQTDLQMAMKGNSHTTYLFVGAKQTTLLDRYMDELSIANFDLAVDFGWFYFLTKPIFYALHWLNSLWGNFGVAILTLTVLIKLILFPLANKSYKSMSKMKLLQPKMLELRDRFKDDRNKLNQAMMDLYKQERVNPLSGCLPILVQIPIFFSLYKVLYVTIEMRHAPFIGWITDLSAPDPLRILNLFGLVPWNVPEILMLLNIGIWPILMGVSMWAQMKLNPAPADPLQQKIFTFMPIIFTFMLANFAAGLVIYWTWNNILSMAQQYIIMKRMGVAIGGGHEKKND